MVWLLLPTFNPSHRGSHPVCNLIVKRLTVMQKLGSFPDYTSEFSFKLHPGFSSPGPSFELPEL